MASQIYSNTNLSNTPVDVNTAGLETISLTYIDCFNTNSDPVYVQFFNVASPDDVVLGTTTPRFSWPIPAGGGHDLPKDKTQAVDFGRGCVIAATTTPSGSTAPATGVNVNIFYTRSL